MAISTPAVLAKGVIQANSIVVPTKTTCGCVGYVVIKNVVCVHAQRCCNCCPLLALFFDDGIA